MTISADVDQVALLAREMAIATAQTDRVAVGVVTRNVGDVVNLSRQFVPVDTGELRDSITGEVNGLEGIAGPTAEHGPAQEFGTAYVPPQPYMGPAAGIVGRRFVRDLAVAGAGLALGSPGGIGQLVSQLQQIAGTDQGVE